MFSKITNLKKWDNKKISLQGLVDLVNNNPNKDKIEYLRSIEYKSEEYIRIKSSLPCITPHGTFKSLKNSDLLNYSGYLFFDVDGIDTISELNDTIQKTIDTIPVSFLQRSISNRGYHFLVKYDTNLLANDTISFNDLYSHVRSLFISLGINIDTSAGGLVRKMIISSDTNFILNDTNILFLDIKSIKKSNGIKRFKTSEREERVGIRAYDTSRDIIQYKDLFNQIKLETKYDDLEFQDCDYLLQDKEYYRIVLPKIIGDNMKHKLYARIINALYFINGNNISRHQIYSYLFYVNSHALHQMDPLYLKRYTNNMCDNVEQNGIRIKTRIKKIHFNKESNLTKKQKQIMGAKLAAKLKINNSIQKICDAKLQIALSGEIPTQSKVQKITGLGIATVKRHWSKDYLSFDIDTPEDKMDPRFPTISEDRFFGISEKAKSKEEPKKKIIKFKFRGYKECICEFTEKDKFDFHNFITSLEHPHEEQVIYADILEDKEDEVAKLWYMWNLWTIKNNYYNENPTN